MNTELKPLDQDDRLWGAIIHLSALIGLLLPLGLVLGPFLVWVMKKSDSTFLDAQGKAALNFQITILIAAFVLLLLGALIKPLLPLAFLTGIVGLVLAVVAGISVWKGKSYDYPWSLRLIS